MQKLYPFIYSSLSENPILNVLRIEMNLKKISAFSILDDSEIFIKSMKKE